MNIKDRHPGARPAALVELKERLGGLAPLAKLLDTKPATVAGWINFTDPSIASQEKIALVHAIHASSESKEKVIAELADKYEQYKSDHAAARMDQLPRKEQQMYRARHNRYYVWWSKYMRAALRHIETTYGR